MKKRTFDKIQHALMMGTQEEVNFLNLIIAPCENLEQTWFFMMGEDAFPRSEQDQDSVFTLLVHTVLEDLPIQ